MSWSLHQSFNCLLGQVRVRAPNLICVLEPERRAPTNQRLDRNCISSGWVLPRSGEPETHRLKPSLILLDGDDISWRTASRLHVSDPGCWSLLSRIPSNRSGRRPPPNTGGLCHSTCNRMNVWSRGRGERIAQSTKRDNFKLELLINKPLPWVHVEESWNRSEFDPFGRWWRPMFPNAAKLTSENKRKQHKPSLWHVTHQNDAMMASRLSHKFYYKDRNAYFYESRSLDKFLNGKLKLTATKSILQICSWLWVSSQRYYNQYIRSALIVSLVVALLIFTQLIPHHPNY